MASIYRRKKGGCYYITYQVRPGRRKTVTGCKDRAATEALARKLEADAMLRREGVIDTKAERYAAAETKPLMEHLAEYHAALLAKGVTRVHANLVRTRAAKVIGLCGARRLSDLVPSSVQAVIGSLRDDEGFSLQTCNHYLRAIKQFSRWLWRDGRARESALAHLAGYNVALDRRHDRRALTDEDLANLVQAAETGPTVMGVPGPDRAMLYRLAVGTGFRANELRSLVPESFDLNADPPTVTVEAGYSKHRRRDVQPIRRDLAERLRPCLADKEPGRPVFRVFSKTAKMMRADLHRAGIPYRDSAGRVADFHALRHTYISRLVQSGVNVKVAQELARHSTPMLTLGVYTHLTLHDRTAALDALAPIETPDPRRETTKATGTGDETASPARSAFSARRYPGTPILAMTCQDEGPRTGKEKGAQV